MAKRSACAFVAAAALAACAHPNAAPTPTAVAPEHFSMMTQPPDHAGAAAEADRRDRAAMRHYLFSAEGPLNTGDMQVSQQSTLQDAMALAERALVSTCQPLGHVVRERLARLSELPALCPAADAQWLLWYAAALTDLAMASDVAVLMAWQKPLVTLWQTLITRGDAAGDAHAYLGLLYARSPAFAGGNLPLAKTHMEQALARQEDAWRTRLWYAEYVLAPMRLDSAAQQTLQELAQASLPPQSDDRPEQQLAQVRARQLLEHLDDLLWRDL